MPEQISKPVLQHETLYLGEKRIRIRTSVLEEKATACNMLCCYADELKEGFFPYIEEVGQQLHVPARDKSQTNRAAGRLMRTGAGHGFFPGGRGELCSSICSCQSARAAQHDGPAHLGQPSEFLADA